MLWWLIVMEGKLELPVGASPTHMLWSLLFLKTCGKETMLSSMAGGIDEKTFRKWAWVFIMIISDLESDVVSVAA